MRQTLSGMAIDLDLGNALNQSLSQPILEGLKAGQPFRHFLASQLCGLTHAHNPDEVLRAGAALVFLKSAVNERPDGSALADIEGADTRGSIKLVGRQAQKVHPQL